MRTTIDILDPLLERTKKFAAGRGKELADVVNDALAEKLSREEASTNQAKPFKFITFSGDGPQPGVDINSNASIQDALDEEYRREDGTFDLEKLR
jgi:hypothetical protein